MNMEFNSNAEYLKAFPPKGPKLDPPKLEDAGLEDCDPHDIQEAIQLANQASQELAIEGELEPGSNGVDGSLEAEQPKVILTEDQIAPAGIGFWGPPYLDAPEVNELVPQVQEADDEMVDSPVANGGDDVEGEEPATLTVEVIKETIIAEEGALTMDVIEETIAEVEVAEDHDVAGRTSYIVDKIVDKVMDNMSDIENVVKHETLQILDEPTGIEKEEISKDPIQPSGGYL